jgi:hypothetical protein
MLVAADRLIRLLLLKGEFAEGSKDHGLVVVITDAAVDRKGRLQIGPRLISLATIERISAIRGPSNAAFLQVRNLREAMGQLCPVFPFC